MLVLFETPAGYSLFKVTDEKKLAETNPIDIYSQFFSSEKDATSFINLISFQPFTDTADAVSSATACCIEGKVPKSLKSFLKKQLKKTKCNSLAVADKTLAVRIKDKVSGLNILHDSKSHELFRGIRCYMDELMDDASNTSLITGSSIRAMQLGLSHSLSRHKLKFSSDKVDTMVIQAVGLLDELDKEINNYAMRVKEWYGWHFPEMQAIVNDNTQYSQIVMTCGFRNKFREKELSNILDDQKIEASLKEAAEVSMGTEVSDLDIINIQALAEQVISMTEYRIQLFEYLKNRMNAIAPNLTILVGELVGARLISHAGSLINLAKHPASTVQILGAEKALFRALKTKHDTPKYGLIYHASLIGQAAPKDKGKISRVLAAKASLATRVDALSDETVGHVDTSIGYEGRARVEARLRQLEGVNKSIMSSDNKNGITTAKKTQAYNPVLAKVSAKPSYIDANDLLLSENGKCDENGLKKDKKKKSKKRKSVNIDEKYNKIHNDERGEKKERRMMNK